MRRDLLAALKPSTLPNAREVAGPLLRAESTTGWLRWEWVKHWPSLLALGYVLLSDGEEWAQIEAPPK